ncbi:hypothetical protein EYC84_011900 [Monilinia fructicola]|uniref:Uncharacterized protein n=1 Tax=Monilinia fructicola TaxID=38448 RepID=A0A5M9J5G0_MONFR|nr:hypothetical protein EYC84_011900 [Monilinia fructicola]
MVVARLKRVLRRKRQLQTSQAIYHSQPLQALPTGFHLPATCTIKPHILLNSAYLLRPQDDYYQSNSKGVRNTIPRHLQLSRLKQTHKHTSKQSNKVNDNHLLKPIAKTKSPAQLTPVLHHGRRPQNNHLPLLRARPRLPARHPLMRPLPPIPAPPRRPNLHPGAPPQLHRIALRLPRRFLRLLLLRRHRPRALLHRIPLHDGRRAAGRAGA